MSAKKLSDELIKQTLDAYAKSGGCKAAAAKFLGIPETTYKSRYDVAIRNSAVSDLVPLIPAGQKLKGTSTLYNNDGDAVMQWVKTNVDLDRQIEIIKETAEALKCDIPKEMAAKFKGNINSDLASLYMITDYHIGQMSWVGECGEDWDTDKAVDFLVRWFSAAIASAPDSEVGILCQGGDFLHFDSMDAVTPTSKHLLDTDTRYARIVAVTIRALRIIIKMLLEKHKHVHVIMEEGNHDLASSIWLRALLAEKYADEPRITIDNTSVPYYVYEHGKTALFFHHGHKKKMTEISKVFAGMFREIFGRTKYAYAHMGHYHHVASKEDSLMIVEQHPSLAVKDAYSARGGYIANRGASVISYSKEHGEVGRITIRPEMIK